MGEAEIRWAGRTRGVEGSAISASGLPTFFRFSSPLGKVDSEITKEKQRISEALERINAQREKLAGELSELETTERVLARYSGTPAKWARGDCHLMGRRT